MKAQHNQRAFEVNTVKEFLEQCAEVWKDINTTPAFVLENGYQFPTMAPEQPKAGMLKACYMNAARLAMRRKDLIYVEGYAAGIIPVMHAWCIDQEGRVLETTWPPALQRSHDYYGIPFCTAYLRKRLQVQEHYGLLDQPDHNWPVQNFPREVWIHPAYKDGRPT